MISLAIWCWRRSLNKNPLTISPTFRMSPHCTVDETSNVSRTYGVSIYHPPITMPVATLALGSRPRQRELQGCGPKEARELSQKEARELSQEDARESRQEEARESHHITSMDCDVLYIIGNLLKRRCLKWARIAHSNI